jgi:hypothetical protein
MKEAFADMIRHDDRVSIHGLAPMFREKKYGYIGGHFSDAIEALAQANKRLRGHGVEEIRATKDARDSLYGDTLALYVNMGDPYTPTIIYDVLVARFYVGGYADWMEWREGNKSYGLGEYQENPPTGHEIEFEVGKRVQLHPATERWMMGDRYGEIVGVGTKHVSVKLDKSGRTMRFIPDHILEMFT